MQTPTVSIIIPTKNRRDLLRETLRSVQSQTYPHWEAIVVDDGSTDQTKTMLGDLAQHEPRIRFFGRSGPRSGAPVCRNQGLAAADGEYVIFLDSDDLLAPFCLENRVATMESTPHLAYGVFPSEVFRKTPGDTAILWNADTGEDDLDRFLQRDNPWQIHHVIWRREALAKVGPWVEELLCWQDWEFHIRALNQNLPHAQFPTVDCYLRVAYEEREAINSVSTSPQYLHSQGLALELVRQTLDQAGLLTPSRRHLIAGMYFFVASCWWKFSKSEARRVWQQCQRHGFIGHFEHLNGVLFISTYHAPILWRLHNRLKPCWQRKFKAYRSSPTLLKTPTPRPVCLHVPNHA